MKVGIFTFPNSTSYGATLQMYALYHAVKDLGHQVEIINYHNAYMKEGKHMSPSSSNSVKQVLKKKVQRFLHIRSQTNFKRFERENISLYPTKAFTDKSKLLAVEKKYDAVICGSDQVWNPEITNNDISFFLDFCTESTRRVSYAPSFGIEDFSGDFCETIRVELEKFYAISAREKQGSELIEKMLGIKVPVVLDPTFLVSRDVWESLAKTIKVKHREYILYYVVRSSPTLFAHCRKLSESTGLPIVVVGGNFVKKIKNRDSLVEYAVDISPAEWLSLVNNANYVVTNSFHGTAFSIIFRKNFYLEFSSFTNSRLSHIVELFGVENRIVEKGVPIVPSDVDYSEVERRLPELVDSSLKYLKKALEEGTADG